jgi:outer membrane immunogenic protein
MKRVLLAVAFAFTAGGVAFAADLPPPPYAPPRAPATYVPVAPVFTWTGIYLGINAGYGFGNSQWSDPIDGSTGKFDASGFLAGGTLGGNYQMGNFVIGLEGDYDWNDLKGTTSSTCAPNICETQSDWLATARGRAGWAWDRVLFYGTGGAAFANIKSTLEGYGATNTTTQVGWTAGAGIEAALTPNWTAKIEYLYVDLGNQSCPSVGFCGGGLGATSSTPVSTNVSLTENIIRAGVNYKFNWW